MILLPTQINESGAMKKLSIITICYNEPNLEKTCESIVNQSWQDFEWIVIDGGSNDEALAIFEKYKYRIDKFVSEPDNGIYDACNKGIKLATGEFLNFMNAGDSFYSDKIIEKFIAINSKADIIYGDTNAVYESTSVVWKYPKILGNKNLFDIAFWHTNNINTQSTFLRHNLFSKYGLFDTTYKIRGDFDRWLRFYVEGKEFHYLPFIIANYDMSGVSSVNRTLRDKEKSEVILKYFSQEEIDEALDKAVRYSLAERIFSIKNTPNKKNKVLTIFGIKFKFKRRKDITK